MIEVSRKVLFVATVDIHFKSFHLPYLKWFKEQGWEVHVAANGHLELPYVDERIHLPVQRSPFRLKNMKAYQVLKSLIDHNHYEIIHCHTPMGGVLTRLAARRSRKLGTKVIYTAHGFHFCAGAPLTNWMIYYPIEKILARSTDCLITINEEDYNLAINKRFKVGRIDRVHGVGVDTERFKAASDAYKQELRKKLGYPSTDFLMFYAAEFNKNKNQQFLVQALALLKELPHVKLLLAGDGLLMRDCRELAVKLGVDSMIDFLGYRTDIDHILPMCDIGVASSLREGLPVNIMEAMACGLPIIASDNRGHRELVHNNKNGWIVNSNDVQEMSDKIKFLALNQSFIPMLGMAGREIVESRHAIHRILDEKCRIYTRYMDGTEELMWAAQ